MRPTTGELTIRAAASFVLVALFVVVGYSLFSKKSTPVNALVPSNTFAAFGGSLPQEPLTLYQTEWNIYTTIFKEPFETAVFLFKDGAVLTFSTHEADRVGVAIQTIVEWVGKTGRSIKDCLRVVHNHFSPGGFTDSDRYTYNYLKTKGFIGVFGIYHTSSGVFQTID
jgi:hypothetical protein